MELSFNFFFPQDGNVLRELDLLKRVFMTFKRNELNMNRRQVLIGIGAMPLFVNAGGGGKEGPR